MREINCPLCNSDQAEPVMQVQDRLLGLEGEFTLVQCPDCKLLYLNPQPTLEELLYYYPAEYDAFVGPQLERLDWLRRISVNYGLHKRCRAVTRYKKQGRLLEIGCATGAFLNAMREAGAWQLYGVDISEHAVRYAREQLGLNVFHGQLEDAGFADEFFDVVVLWDVLEHLPQPQATLLEIRRILAKDGLLVFRVPNLDSLGARLFGRYWAGLDAPRHLTVFSKATLKQLFETSGFVLQQMVCISGTFPTFVLSVRFWAQEHLPARAQTWLVRVLDSLPVRLLVAPFFLIIDKLKKSSVITVYAKIEAGN